MTDRPVVTWAHARGALLKAICQCTASLRNESPDAPRPQDDSCWLVGSVATAAFGLGAVLDGQHRTGNIVAAAVTAVFTAVSGTIVFRLHRSEHWEMVGRLEDLAERFRAAAQAEACTK